MLLAARSRHCAKAHGPGRTASGSAARCAAGDAITCPAALPHLQVRNAVVSAAALASYDQIKQTLLATGG